MCALRNCESRDFAENADPVFFFLSNSYYMGREKNRPMRAANELLVCTAKKGLFLHMRTLRTSGVSCS